MQSQRLSRFHISILFFIFCGFSSVWADDEPQLSRLLQFHDPRFSNCQRILSRYYFRLRNSNARPKSTAASEEIKYLILGSDRDVKRRDLLEQQDFIFPSKVGLVFWSPEGAEKMRNLIEAHWRAFDRLDRHSIAVEFDLILRIFAEDLEPFNLIESPEATEFLSYLSANHSEPRDPEALDKIQTLAAWHAAQMKRNFEMVLQMLNSKLDRTQSQLLSRHMDLEQAAASVSAIEEVLSDLHHDWLTQFLRLNGNGPFSTKIRSPYELEFFSRNYSIFPGIRVWQKSILDSYNGFRKRLRQFRRELRIPN